ncbi:hypothetical protein OHB12_04445 [Nocardia sp. NBC_01730]|nr:hypothetical protein OHB12_04445 [Nocardia sp. NBC_01730]
MFSKVLVANCGTIAIRAAYELGIGTVAVFPYEDRNSVHRLMALAVSHSVAPVSFRQPQSVSESDFSDISARPKSWNKYRRSYGGGLHRGFRMVRPRAGRWAHTVASAISI